MASTQRVQDMPPQGGYKPIWFKRVPIKTYFSGPQLFLGYIGVTAASFYLYYLSEKKQHRENIENRSGTNAIYPFLLAERDREYLKQLRRNREEEAELMKDVPGWEVGTWYGEPVFKLLPKDTLVDPNFKEFYVHTDYKHLSRRYHMKLLS